MEPTSEQIQEAMLKLQRELLKFTCRLVRLDDFKNLKEVASGFIIFRHGKYVLLSAGHALKNPGWHLETDVIIEDSKEVLTIPLFEVFKLEEIKISNDKESECDKPIDFAFVILPISALKQEVEKHYNLKGKKIELPAYSGPLHEAPIENNEAYGYSSWSKVLMLEGPWNVLERTATSEFGLQYIGLEDNNRYQFLPFNGHQGHGYYYGASGSPIVDPSGKIVSLLLGGEEKKGILYGLRIPKFLAAIDVALQEKESSPRS